MANQTEEALLDSQWDERRLGTGLTSLEFEADMMPLLKKDPIAMLGYKAAFANRGKPIRKLPEGVQKVSYDTSENPKGPRYSTDFDAVSYGRDYGASKDVILHELRHRGLKLLEAKYQEKDKFSKKYGDQAYNLLYEASGIPGTKSNEFITELYDNPKATFIMPGAEGAKNSLANLSDTIQMVDINSDSQYIPDAVDNLLGIAITQEGHDEIRAAGGKRKTISKEEIAKGKSGLDKAARDLLTEIGVLGFDAEPKQKFAEGGDVAAQTEEALGWTAEGQKFAEANPVDIKAPEALSIKNVPAFDRPMSAGPKDKWTGKQDELGNREYKSQLDGSTYFIKPDSDQRTELEKIQQDIIPAVTKYLENPTAPSKEQTIEFLKSAAGDAWKTISIPGDLVSGDKTLGDVTLGDVFEVSGSAAVASLPMSVPKGSMRTFGGSNPPTYKLRDKSLSSQVDEFFGSASQEYLDVLNTSFIMFREPIVDFAGTVDIPKKGLLGSEFLTLIKKNDSIPETSLQEGIIEPGKRYTKEELLKALGTNKEGTFKSVANIASDKPKQFEGFQRQGKDAGFEGGREIEYFDIPIDTSIGFPGKKFKANEQHYDSDTLVHVRGSIIVPENSGPWDTDFLVAIQGEGYLLVEEIQSDLLTKGFVRPKNKFDADFSNATDDFSRSRMVSYGEAFGSIDKEIKSVVKELEIDIDKYTADLIDSILDVGPIGSALITPKQSTAIENYYRLIEKKLADKKIAGEVDPLELDNIYQAYLSNKKISDTYPNPNNIGLPPIRKNKQAVDEALKILIAKAAQSGVTKIVIPPAERIALARGRKLQEDKGDRFYRTYVTDLQKSLSELQDNYPVKIYREELPYKRHEDFVGFVPEEIVDDDIIQGAMTDLLDDELGITNTLSNTSTSKIGTIIDITELVDKYKVEKPRQFAQGGVVEDMNRQMEMFAVGGLSDDGMTRDPVSGNDIPPGSMAEEVRDDIPAQLSEGEYVVPADVVRFFGVKYFEDLRTEAKMGLSNMEANGRIGGEPVPSGGPMAGPTESALTPEEMAALAEMGMNVGGFVPQQPPPEAIGNPVQTMESRKDIKGYAPGGSVVDFNPANYGLGFSVYGQPSSTTAAVTAPSTVALYSPDGVMRSLTLPAEQAEYDRLIAEGWSTEMTAETSVGKDDSGPKDIFDDGPKAPPKTLEELEADLAKLNDPKSASTIITKILGGLGLNRLTNLFGQGDLIEITRESIKSQIKTLKAEQGGGTSGAGIGSGSATISPQQKSFDDKNLQAANIASSSSSSSQDGESAIERHQRIFSAAKESGASAGVAASGAAKAVTSGIKDPKELEGGAELDTAYGISGLKTGGFVSKRTKKKKK